MPVIGNGDIRTIADAEQMFLTTGCAGISIGRGALLNPWFFAQLARWHETGDPGPPAGYQRPSGIHVPPLPFLVGQRGEHFASLTFRKVANWYCRVLKPGRDIQQRLIMLERVADFDQHCHLFTRQWDRLPIGSTAPSRKLPCRKGRSPTGRLIVSR